MFQYVGISWWKWTVSTQSSIGIGYEWVKKKKIQQKKLNCKQMGLEW